MPVDVTGIDHIYLAVSDLDASERFYDRVMSVLDFRKRKGRLARSGDPHVHYFNRVTQFSLRPARTSGTVHDPYAPGLHHLCFRVADRNAVDQTARELARLGIEASEPAPYPQYHEDYYATFFEDPDAVRLEIMNHVQFRRDVATSWESFEVIEVESGD